MTEEYDRAEHWPGARAVDFWRDPTIVRPVCKCGWAAKRIFRPRKGFDPIETAIQYARDHGHVEPREWLAKNNPKLLESMDRAAGVASSEHEIHAPHEGSVTADGTTPKWWSACPVCGTVFTSSQEWQSHRKSCWGKDLMGLHDDDKFVIYDRVEAMRQRGASVKTREAPSGFPEIKVIIGGRVAFLTDCLSLEDWQRKRTGTRHFIVSASNIPYNHGVNAKDAEHAVAMVADMVGHSLEGAVAKED